MPGARTPVDNMGALSAKDNINAMGSLAQAEMIHSDVAACYQYKNVNTGQVVEYPHRSPRLDALDVWLLIGAPPVPEFDPDTDTAMAESAVAADPASGVIRPAEHENKREWVAYAVWRGMPERDARVLSKAALITEFGEGSDDGED